MMQLKKKNAKILVTASQPWVFWTEVLNYWRLKGNPNAQASSKIMYVWIQIKFLPVCFIVKPGNDTVILKKQI